MYKHLFKTALITTACAAALCVNLVSATADSSLITRGEHREHANMQHHPVHAGELDHHPAARDATRHDINRNADANALQNAAVPIYPDTAPAYPTTPSTTINVNPNTPPAK